MSQETKTDAPDVELLGQKFYLPNSLLKLCGLVAILIFLTIIITSLIKNRYGLKKDKDGGISLIVATIDDKVNLKRPVTIGFWTPSDNTEKTLVMTTAKDSLEYKWQTNHWQTRFNHKHSIDSLNMDFGKKLKKDLGFKGYRRFRVYGEGASGLKEGWWWNISFDGNCDAAFLKELKKAYIEFWNPDVKGKEWDNLYVEIIGDMIEE